MANRVLIEKEIKEYCNLNNINDVSGFITQCLLRGFNIFRYGTSPGDNIKRQNGDIVDNGSNRTHRKKEKIGGIKTNNKIEDSLQNEMIEEKVTEVEQEVVVNSPVIVKRKGKITVTSID